MTLLACCICAQANFVGDAQYKQHLDSAIHRKALAKEEARKQRERQLGANAGAAESAVVRALVSRCSCPAMCLRSFRC